MPRWDKACEDNHVFEYSGSYAEHEEAKKAGIPCPTCGKPTQTKITLPPGRKSLGILYNCGGFYGSVPTELAHNTGQI